MIDPKIKDHLTVVDPILGILITQITLHNGEPVTNYFAALTESIISQQLSIKAADTIFNRFLDLFKTKEFPPPQQVIVMSNEKLRSSGISYQKINYIKDLAQRVYEGKLNFPKLIPLADEMVIQKLIQVKGIGRWTAEMFLMFALDRPDVFSYGDLGIKNAMKKVYKLKSHPSEKKAQQMSNKWKPYRTYACRYLWKSLELIP